MSGRYAGQARLMLLEKRMVPPVGLEPTRLAALDFESSASTIPPQGQQLTYNQMTSVFQGAADSIFAAFLFAGLGLAFLTLIAEASSVFFRCEA